MPQDILVIIKSYPTLKSPPFIRAIWLTNVLRRLLEGKNEEYKVATS